MRRLIPVILVAILAIAGWLIFGAKKSSQSNQIGGGGPATDAVLSNPSPADWPMYRRTYNGWGYSPLNKINKDNVASLEFTWSTAIGPGAVESTPVVYQGSLYLPQPNDIIEAFNGKTGDRLWVYSRDLPRDLDSNPSYVQRTTRNIAFYQDKVFHATLDGYVIALEAKTGKLAWESQVADYKQMVQVAGPIIVKGKVITGRACILGVPEGCFIVAHDAVTGKEV